MALNTRLIDNILPNTVAPPQSYSGVAMTAYWQSLAKYNHITYVISTGAWAGGTAAVTMNQATSVAGAGSKALAFSWMWVNTAALQDTFTKTAVVSNTFTLGTAALTYVIEVDAATLDVNNSFNYITLAIASPGGNADFYNVVALLSMARYDQATLPTAIL